MFILGWKAGKIYHFGMFSREGDFENNARLKNYKT